MATEVEHTIGTGETYTTIGAWESAQQRDLVSDDEVAIANLKSQTFTEYVVIAGWTCDATRHVFIRAASGAEYEHAADTGAKVDRGNSFTLNVQTSCFLKLQDIGVGNITDVTPLYHTGNDAFQRIDRCTVMGLKEITTTGNFSGCDFYSSLITIGTSTGSADFRYTNAYNCTVICDNSTGAVCRDGDFDNTICQNANETPTFANFYSATGDYNAESVSSAAGPPGANSITDVPDSDFEDYAGGDYHQAGDTTDIYHAGSTLSDPTIDHDGVSYHATTASIGAFEYVAAGGGGGPTAGTLSLLGVGI